jgi:nuclear pore complex protein Nup210
MTCRIPDNGDASFFNWLTDAKFATLRPLHKGLGTAAVLLPCMIRKHRNDCVFEGSQPSISPLMTIIMEEAAL